MALISRTTLLMLSTKTKPCVAPLLGIGRVDGPAGYDTSDAPGWPAIGLKDERSTAESLVAVDIDPHLPIGSSSVWWSRRYSEAGPEGSPR